MIITTNQLKAIGLGFTLVSATTAAAGGDYRVTRSTIDGGGVVHASGGDFACSGTVGQHDAGAAMLGGEFRFTGGFWPGVGRAASVLPAIETVITVNDHDGIGPVGAPVNITAAVEIDSGEVTTESRVGGITRLEITFADALDPSVGSLGDAAVDIVPDPGVAIATSLADDDHTLILEFASAPANEETYAVQLSDSVISVGPTTFGDRGFELRALVGNVYHESGPGPQTVNAMDLGMDGGLQSRFSADVSDPANARFDVTQDGVIDALDLSCVRLTCGAFATTAP